MKNGLRVMDSDLHAMEPDDLWDRYLAEEWKPHAPKVTRDPRFPLASSTIQIQGNTISGHGTDEAAARPSRDLEQRTLGRSAHYDLAVRRGFDADTHLMAMDVEGVDVAILYATRGRQALASDDLDPAYAAALCCAYNNWAYDYVQRDPGRLKLAAQVPFHDAELAAAEACRAVEALGAVAIVGVPNPVNGRQLHDAFFDQLWGTVQRLGVPVGFHPTAVSALREDVGRRFRGHPAYDPISHAVRFPVESMLAYASLAMGGVFERFPDLTVVLLEATCGWLPWWLARLDDQWAKFGPGCEVKLSARPSEYFFRQCYIATDPEETTLASVIGAIGDDRIVLSTDYPHLDSLFPHAVETFLGLEGVSDASKQKILWDNCARLYGLGDLVAQ